MLTFYKLVGLFPDLPDQYAYPVSDISPGSWTTDTGATTNLYAAIDEVTRNDADYIKSPNNLSPDECEVAIGSLSDPGTGLGHKIFIVHAATGAGTVDLRVRLVQGNTVIAEQTYSAVGGTPTLFMYELSAGEANSITNYGDLRFRFRSTAT